MRISKCGVRRILRLWQQSLEKGGALRDPATELPVGNQQRCHPKRTLRPLPLLERDRQAGNQVLGMLIQPAHELRLLRGIDLARVPLETTPIEFELPVQHVVPLAKLQQLLASQSADGHRHPEASV